MKKFIWLAVAVVIIVAGIIFVPKLVHECDDCEEIFFGTGYEPNVLSDLFSKEDQIICKECAEKQHAITLALGKTLDDFKIGLFD